MRVDGRTNNKSSVHTVGWRRPGVAAAVVVVTMCVCVCVCIGGCGVSERVVPTVVGKHELCG